MNILLTSAGRRSYLVDYFKDVIGEGRVFASNSEYSMALKVADGFFISPKIYEDGYIDSIVEFCKEEKISAIISLFDIDLWVLAKNREYIESNGIRLLLASSEAVEVCNDKWKTSLMLQKIGVKTPKTYKDLSVAKKAIENGQLNFPVVVKPRWGMGSMSIFIADDLVELECFYNKSRKEIAASYLKYESILTPNEDVLIQEKLEGQEYGVDVINDLDGNYVCSLPKKKLVMRAGETDLGESVNAEMFEVVAKKLSDEINHQVILSVDCFDVSGEIYVTELNCRISGHYPVSHLSGANLPKQIVAWLRGEATDINNFVIKEGVIVAKDLLPVVLELGEKPLGADSSG